MSSINILVLLYNKEITDSQTIKSLIFNKDRLGGCCLTIWNNGPNKLKDLSLSDMIIDKCEIKIVETIENLSLSQIYNTFIQDNNAEKYIVLDDDSSITREYLDDALKCNDVELAVPLIKYKNKNVGPFIDGTVASYQMLCSEDSTVIAIGSGMVITKNAAMIVKSAYGDIFDENFRFYGVDVTFCYRVNSLKNKINVKVISGFEHSLSKMQNESKQMKEFRKKERSYDLGLRLRYYYPIEKSLMIIFKTITLTFLKKCLLIENTKYNNIHLIHAFITGNHYKSSRS